MPSSKANRGNDRMREEIDYDALKRLLLDRAEDLVQKWLPGGEKIGGEWKCADLEGGRGHSCSVNLNTGAWADFADDNHRGKDLISLYAAKHGLEQWEAARDLVDNYRLKSECVRMVPVPVGAGDARAKPDKAPKPAAAAETAKKKGAGEKGEWVPVLPVPSHAPAIPKHPYRGEPQRVWKYTRAGELLGYVCRFETSDGGKEIIPCTWCQSLANEHQKWVWKTWAEPRPLYLPSGELRAGVIKVVVEGEKCADALHGLIGDEFDVVSWPGGGKAVDKADWDWLLPGAGAAAPVRVILWPDADYQRRRPSAEEKADGIEPNDPRLDYMPEAKQPGVWAMEKLAKRLQEGMEAQIWMVRPPPPPAKPSDPPPLPDGWDCADAIADGWDAEKCKAHLRAAKRWEAAAAHATAAAAKSTAGASGEIEPTAWRSALIKSPETGAIKAVRENVVLALQCLPETKGKIAFNEFTNNVVKLADMPWGSPAGEWSEVDELLMGEWLCRKHWLPSMAQTTLVEATRMVAHRHQYHPVRKYLQGLKWDGQARLNDWLIVAAVDKPEQLPGKTAKYLRRVGAWFLMGMVARAMRPGCKFDYMPILEGEQGMRKSTVLNVLAGEWFADTGFVLGDKDTLQMLQGRWLYEISELDAMARAEVTKIKAFVASKEDWYRASFDKRPKKYPRQLVFAGTTNEHQYLVDPTGNRRFWPVEVTRVIDTDWVAASRDQLFAEAWARVQQGERYFPTQREELELFLPQQRQRMVESAIEIKLLDYLVNHNEGSLKTSAQIVELLGAIGIDLSKLGPGRFHEKQAGAALRKFGWVRQRLSSRKGDQKGYRPWAYVRPDRWPDCLNLDDLDEETPAPAVKQGKTPGRTAPGSAARASEAHERADYDESGLPPVIVDEDGGDEPF